MRKILLVLLLLFVVLFGVLLINTFTSTADRVEVDRIATITIDDLVVDRLSKAIQIKTISYDDFHLMDTASFRALRNFFEESFPLVHSNLEREIIANNSLLFKWRGKDEGNPVILLGHMDVVPVEATSLDLWEEGPFSGTVKDGFIWGRGSLDDKNAVLGILEAVEKLLAEGFIPPSDVYLAFGHDEEVGGLGATAIASLLKERNIRAHFVLDEGGIISDGIVPGINEQVALIGTAEKGYTSLELSIKMEGGHSSMPPKETTIEVLSRAIVKLRDNPFPARFSPPVRELLETISPHMAFFQRLVLSNLWLFKPVVVQNYEQTTSGNASIRTTLAPTIFKSGIKENLLPVEATAVLNFRILPGETSDEVIEYVKTIIDDDRIQVKKSGFLQEPTFVSPSDNPQFNLIKISARQVFGEVIASPFLVIAATDSRHFMDVSDNIYRFSPMILKPDDLQRIHGINEKISIENYKNGIRFYYQVLKNLL